MAKTEINILIVDDSPDDVAFYCQLLESYQGETVYNVYAAEDGESALDIWRNHAIDCTLIDYNLPAMNGLKVIELLQAHAQIEQLPILMLTGEPHQKIQAEATKRGVLDYIVKDSSTTSEDIQAIIKKTINWASKPNDKVAF